MTKQPQKPNFHKLYVTLYNCPEWLEMSALHRWLYVVLLTGSQSNSIGCYVCRLSVLAEDAGFDVTLNDLETVCKQMGIQFDNRSRTVYIPNRLKWDPPANPNVLDGMVKTAANLPKCENQETVMQTVALMVSELVIMTDRGRKFIDNWQEKLLVILNRFSNSLGNGLGNASETPYPQPYPYPYPKPQPYPQPKPKPNNIAPAARGAVKFNPMLHVEIPEWLGEHWAMWCTHRLEIKKPLTKSQSEMTIKKLVEWGPERAKSAIRHSIEKGYQGLFEPKSNGKNSTRELSAMELAEQMMQSSNFEKVVGNE